MTEEIAAKVMPKFKKGEKIKYKNTGYGCTSYEEGEVIKQTKTKLFTDAFEDGIEWSISKKAFVFDSGLGLVTTVIKVSK